MRNPRFFTPALRLLALGIALLGASLAHAAGEPIVPALNWHPCPEYPGYGYECATCSERATGRRQENQLSCTHEKPS